MRGCGVWLMRCLVQQARSGSLCRSLQGLSAPVYCEQRVSRTGHGARRATEGCGQMPDFFYKSRCAVVGALRRRTSLLECQRHL